MEITLQKEHWDITGEIAFFQEHHEETGEIFCTDSQADFSSVLDTTVRILLEEKKAFAGGLSVSGRAAVTALVEVENGEIDSVQGYVPYGYTLSCAEATEETLWEVSVGCIAADARPMGGGKAMARLELALSARGFAAESRDIAARTPEMGEYLSEKKTVTVTEGVWEKTFTVSDRYPLAAGNPPIEKLLRCETQIQCQEGKSVGRKIIAGGKVQVWGLYVPRGEKTLRRFCFETEFSQIMEGGAVSENAKLFFTPAVTGEYITGESMDGETLSMELTIHLQCTAVAQKELCYLSDGYVLEHPAELHRENWTLIQTCLGELHRETVTDCQLITDLGRILDGRLTPGSVQHREGETVLSLSENLLYTDGEGHIQSRSREVFFSLGSAQSPKVWAEGPCRIVSSEKGVELSQEILVQSRVRKTESISYVDSVSCEEASFDKSGRAGLVLHRTVAGETLWSLARGFHSTRKAIAQSNGWEEEAELPLDVMALIPKM